MDTLPLVVTVASASWWSLQAVIAARAIRSLPRIADMPEETCESWPALSMIVPARNEAASLEAAVQAKLAEGYPNVELVLVDDRSEDATAAIADRLAAADPRLTVEHNRLLPDGWLGKVHAMHRGLLRARGEWILFSDADVHLAPGTMRRVIAWAERERVDHVAVVPTMVGDSAVLTASMACVGRLITVLGRLGSVADPSSKAAIGVGAFNLVRREALRRTPGLEWLKMEIADDVALGIMLKRCGARQRAVVGNHFVHLDFYPSFRDLARALEKNGASAPAPIMLVMLALLLLLELGVVFGLGAGGVTGVVAFVGLVIAMVTQASISGWLSLPRWPALLSGLAMVPLAGAIARAAVLAWVRGGVVWRGTFYSLAVVRAGARLGQSPTPVTLGAEVVADR